MTECKHSDFNASVSVHPFEDIAECVADIRISCKDCGLPFSFVGLPPGISVHRATVSVDGTEAHLVIQPGPKPVPLSGTFVVEAASPKKES